MRISFNSKLGFAGLTTFSSKHSRHFAVVILTIMFLSACGSNTDSENAAGRGGQSRAVEIIPHTVTMRADTIEVQAVGTARAQKAAVIRADDGGEVTAVYFQAGDRVSKGDVLMALELDEERLAVASAQVAVRDAEQLIARFKGSTLRGAISDSRIDEVKTAADAARIELSLAEVALARREIRAPFSGIVGLTNIDPGARITSDTEITRLDDRSILFVDFQAPEEVYGRIVAGDLINIEPFSNAGQIYQAEVHKIDSRIDEASRSFTVRAQIDNADDKLRPGMSFKIEFQLPGRTYPVVPEAAIIWGGDGAYVWLVENDLAQRVSVTIVSRQDGQVLVRAPIAEGNVVVAEGVQKVRVGTNVTFSELYARPQTMPPISDPVSAPIIEAAAPPPVSNEDKVPSTSDTQTIDVDSAVQEDTQVLQSLLNAELGTQSNESSKAAAQSVVTP